MNTLSGLLIISCLLLFGSSRLKVSIRIMAVQGMISGLVPFIHTAGNTDAMVWLIGLSGIVFKGIVLPWLLFLVVRRSAIRREIEPFIGFNLSILAGIGMLALSSWLALHLLSAGGGLDPVLLSAALFMVLTGLFLIISRRKAITQVMGYLVMENGIYTLGIGVGSELQSIVELGILLDVSVGVFLMGIMLFHINREFNHIDADQLGELGDHPRMLANRESHS